MSPKTFSLPLPLQPTTSVEVKHVSTKTQPPYRVTRVINLVYKKIQILYILKDAYKVAKDLFHLYFIFYKSKRVTTSNQEFACKRSL